MKNIIKEIYNLIPFKYQMYSFLKVFWTPPPNLQRHLHFKGLIKVKVDDKNFRMKSYGYQLENEVFWNGLENGWEKDSISLWIKLCKNAQVIFDIGANTGIYSLIAKTVNPNATVFAFEPVERVFEKLQHNIELNHFDIVPVKKAASNFDGVATIYDMATEHIYSVTVNKNLSTADVKVIETQIETISLNTFVGSNNIRKVDLIKLDVETHEPEVLEGFSEYLSEHKPAMLIEILTDEVGAKVEKIIGNNGYLYFNLNEKGGIRQVDKIRTSDYYNYLICSPSIARELGILDRI
jgi:FkbM family methyltransferase